MGDSMQPTFLTLDAQGRVSADFTGHLHAAGLDLDAGEAASPPNDRRVSWLRTSDGHGVGYVAAFVPSRGGLGSELDVFAIDPDFGADYAGVNLEAKYDGAHSRADVVAADSVRGETRRLLLDSLGASDFLQLRDHPGAKLAYIPNQFVAFPANDGSGNSSAAVPLGFGWSQHLAFIVVRFWPAGHWNFFSKIPQVVNDASSGAILISNGGGAQNFEVTALSIGIP